MPLIAYPQQRASHILVKILQHTLRLGIQRATATKRTKTEKLKKKKQQLSVFGRQKTGPISIKMFKDHPHVDGALFHNSETRHSDVQLGLTCVYKGLARWSH